MSNLPAPELPVLFRDASLLVVNKPSGMLVHKGLGNDKVVAMTLARDLVGAHVFPVHRLDRGTSGALAFALSSEMARSLSQSFEEGRVEKRYLLLVRGVTPEAGTIDHPVPKDEGGERVPAHTTYRRLFVFERFSLVEALPTTGRFHQLRRHFKHLSHPVVGDVNYGKGDVNRLFRERFGLHRLALHARSLTLPHPLTGVRLTFVAPLPDELRRAFEAMGIPVALWS